MKIGANLRKAALNYGAKALAVVLEHGGQRLRRASNRLTTYALTREYFKSAPYTLTSMLGGLSPEDFGSKENTVFISAPGCQMAVDKFLKRSGWARTPIELERFRNGESYARIQGTVRNKTVVFFQDFKSENINNDLIETLLSIDAAKRASAERVILVCPELPYIREIPGTQNHKIDYFKLVLNLLFKAAQLDQLRVGNIVLSRDRSLLFLQDRVFSRDVAPTMISWSAHFDPARVRKAEDLVFMIGRHYRENAERIIDILDKKHGINGEIFNLEFADYPRSRKINCNYEREIDFLGKTIYIFQSCNTGRINDDFMEALLMVYTAKKRGASKIVLVMPYLPYNRQERKAKTREAISAKLVANALVESAGATQIITLDLHASATQGFVDIPFQHVTAFQLVARFIKSKIRRFDAGSGGWLGQNPVPFSPDAGRAKVARKLGQTAIGPDFDFGIVEKYRPKPGEAKVAAVVGDVRARDVVFIDDIADSVTTLLTGVEAVHSRGASRVYVAVIHGVFSNVTIPLFDEGGKRIEKAFEEYENILKFLKSKKKDVEDYVKRDKNAFTVNALIRLQAHPYVAGIIFTDSLNVPQKNIIDKERIKMISIANLLAMVCSKIITGTSLQDYQYEGQ